MSITCPKCHQDTAVTPGWGAGEASDRFGCPFCSATIEVEWETGCYSAVGDDDSDGGGGGWTYRLVPPEELAREEERAARSAAEAAHLKREAHYATPHFARLTCADEAAAARLADKLNGPAPADPYTITIAGAPYDVRFGNAHRYPDDAGRLVCVVVEVHHSRPANPPDEVSQWSLGG